MPLFDAILALFGKLGASISDMILLIMLGGSFWWFKSIIKSMRLEWAKSQRDIQKRWDDQNEKWNKQFEKLQEDWESTFSILQSGMKESLAQVSKINDEHLSGIKELLTELKSQKTWAGECELKHRALEEWKQNIEQRLREGNDKFRDIEKQIRELRG